MNNTKIAISSGILLGVLFSFSTKAQEIPYINSQELIQKGVKEHDEGNYKKAISYYGQVPEGDTNYLLSLYERSLSSLHDTNYIASIEYGQTALKYKYNDRRQVLLNMGTAYDEMGKEQEAVKLYDSVARLYPHDNRPFYEKAVIYFKKERYAEAEPFLQKSLMLNPLHFRSHYLLGSLYASEGRLSEAIMALQASLLCTNDINLAKGPIALLNAIALQTDEIAEKYSQRKPEYAHPVFDEIDEIVHAKLALNKGYKLKTPIEDNIVRQIQVVLEKLSYNPKDQNFAMQYYVPLLKSIYDQDQFESFVLLLFSEYGIASIDKMAAARKGKARLEEVRVIVYPYLSKIGATRILDYEKRKSSTEIYNSFPQENIIIVGQYADKETKKFAPGFVQLYEDQLLVAAGNYDKDGKKTGIWNYYYEWDKPRLKEEYKSGELTGDAIAWYENGNVMRKMKFSNGGVVTERYHYEYDGTPDSKGILKGKDEYEVTYFFPDGSTKQVLTVKGDKLVDGSYSLRFNDGKLNKEMSYKDEKLHGPFKNYFPNGKPDEVGTYKNGQLEGAFFSYYENGKLAGKYNYTDGRKDGLTEEYREDGTLALKKNYNNGKSDGEATYYNKEGKIYGVINFRNDRMLNAKFFSPEGKVISEQQNINPSTPVHLFNEYGNPKADLGIDEKGKSEGKSTYYFLCGTLKEETEYKDDNYDGASVTYYKNGARQTKRQYVQGTSDGYYQSYFPNGILQTEGWIKAGVSQGTWRNYNVNGTVSREFFLVNDELNGPEVHYECNGKKDFVNHFDNGMIVGLTQFDSTGKVIQELTFDKGEGQYTMLYFNGNPGLQCQLKHGKLHGPYVIQSPDKKLLEKGTYNLGKRDGECITYYPNGKLRLKGTYKKGEKYGAWISYEPDESIESITSYYDDQMEGPDSVYAGGQLRYVSQYHDDTKDGPSVTYGDDGKVAGVLYYDRGTVIGYSYEGSDGKLLPVTSIVKGTADIKTLYANGAKALDLKIVKNCYEGNQKLYFTNGKVAEDRTMVHDDYEGLYARFNQDGSKLVETHFKKDVQEGEERKYDEHGNLIYTANYIAGQPHGKAQIKGDKGLSPILYYYGTLE